MQKIVLHIIFMLVVVTANAQRYEAWLDGDYNHRTIAAYSGGDISQSIDVASLSPGLHFYNIRTQDGKGMWGAVARYLFMVPGLSDKSGPVRFESWLDGDYEGRTIRSYTGGDILDSTSVASLLPGIHYYNIRVCDKHGVGGAVARYLFMVPSLSDKSGPVRFESWLDGDYEGRTIRSYTGGDILDSTSVASLLPGIHYYNIRVCDKHGVWGAVNRYLFLKTEAVRPVRISYWLDNDTLMTAEKAISGASVELSVSLANQGAGQHTFNCQLQDNNGKWTPVYSYDFTIEQQKDTLTHEPVMAEYFIDTDPGYGKGIPLQKISTDTLHFVLSIEGLKAGAHMLYVRSSDDGGKWSSTVARPLYVSPVRQEQFVQMEYFFDDNDPGNGKATPLSDFKANMELLVSQLPITGLQAGSHTLNVRGMTEDGVWSSVITRPFIIIAVQPATPFVEYYFDIDPGYGKGFTIQNVEDGTSQLAIDLSGLLPGAHILYLRTNDKSRWSSTIARPLYVCGHTDIVALEYFFDENDPGEGKATQVALPNNLSSTFTFEVPLNHLKVGDHLLHVRAKGNDGLWSVISTDAFAVTENTGINELYSNSIPTITYTLKGYQSMNEKGVNIIRYKDGRTRKVVKK